MGTFIETATWVTSLAALALSAFSFFHHERKIGKLKRESLERNAQALRKAELMLNIERSTDGGWRLFVTNRGAATARDITIQHPDNDGVLLMMGEHDRPFPRLLCNQTVSFPVALAEGRSLTPEFKVRYSDDEKDGKEIIINLTTV